MGYYCNGFYREITQTLSNTIYENSKYNQLNYKLPESSIYIFKNGLFTRSLLDIDISKDRQILV